MNIYQKITSSIKHMEKENLYKILDHQSKLGKTKTINYALKACSFYGYYNLYKELKERYK